jgi:hypothetical protein
VLDEQTELSFVLSNHGRQVGILNQPISRELLPAIERKHRSGTGSGNASPAFEPYKRTDRCSQSLLRFHQNTMTRIGHSIRNEYSILLQIICECITFQSGAGHETRHSVETRLAGEEHACNGHARPDGWLSLRSPGSFC